MIDHNPLVFSYNYVGDDDVMVNRVASYVPV